MTVPIGNGQGRKIIYNYDNTGKMIDMDVKPVAVATSAISGVYPPDSPAKTKFYYDSNGNRVEMVTKTGQAYFFVYDPTASVPAVVLEIGPQKRYLNIRKPDGSLVTRETYNGSGIRTMSRTYHFDGLGSTIALSDENGSITDEYKYDAWGNVTSHTGTTTDNPYQYAGQYGYYTHYQEPTFGLLQLGVRYYDPSVGRFTQIDPAKDGVNLYCYVSDNPLGRIDPTGLIDWDNPDNIKMAETYICQFGCLLEFIGIPVSKDWQKNVSGFLQGRAQNRIMKGIDSILENKRNPKKVVKLLESLLSKETLESLGLSHLTGNDIRKALKNVKCLFKLIGLYQMAKCCWGCVNNNYHLW